MLTNEQIILYKEIKAIKEIKEELNKTITIIENNKIKTKQITILLNDLKYNLMFLNAEIINRKEKGNFSNITLTMALHLNISKYQALRVCTIL